MTSRAWTEPVPTLEELGAVHFVGHRRRGDVRHRADPARPRRAASPAATPDTPTLLALRALGATVPRRATTRRNLGDADTVVVSTAIRAGQPRAGDGARARAARAAPRGGAGRGDGRAPRRRGGRHARQDHDHLDADRRGAGTAGSTRPSPSAATSTSPGSNAHAGRGRPLRRRGRRERRLLPAAGARSAASSPTSRPTTWTTTATSPPSRPRFDRFLQTVDPGGLRRRLRRRPRRGRGCAACRRPAPDAAPTASAADADLRLTDLEVGPRRHLRHRRRSTAADLGRVRIQVPGEHMALNAPPRCWPAWSWGCPPTDLIEGLGASAGCTAGFELKGVVGRGPRLRRLRPPPDRGRPRSCARPARWPATAGWWSPSSRTSTAGRRSSPPAFGEALGLADEVVVMDVYGAGRTRSPA